MLTPEQIKKVVGSELDAAKTKLPVGVHTFDCRMTLEVSGSVKVLPDSEYTPTVDIPLLATLARFAEKAGVVGPRLLDMLCEAATEALEKGEPVGDYIEHSKAAMRMVRERVISKLPKKARNGAVNRAVEVRVVEFVPLQFVGSVA